MSKASKEIKATHEVADCDPDKITASRDSKWEPCVILRNRKTSYDVGILTASGVVEANKVPKRFVRELKDASASTTPQPRKRKRCSTYGWSDQEIKHLEEAKLARIQALKVGASVSQPNAFVRDYLQLKGITKRFVYNCFMLILVSAGIDFSPLSSLH